MLLGPVKKKDSEENQKKGDKYGYGMKRRSRKAIEKRTFQLHAAEHILRI
jgi:hypothetical protein